MLLSDTPCIGPVDSSESYSVVASSTGWLATLASDQGFTIVALDASGNVTATRAVVDHEKYGVVGGVHLYPRVGAGPLLVWNDDPTGAFPAPAALHAELLADDGAATWRVDLPNMESSENAAVFVDDGFEVVMNQHVSGTFNGLGPLQLAHIALDGTVRLDATVPATDVSTQIAPPNLTWDGTAIRLTYTTNDPSTSEHLQAITAGGALSGEPLGLPQFGYQPSVFGLGSDLIVEMPSDGVVVMRFDAAGKPVWPAARIAQSPYGLTAMVEQGGDAVVAWISHLGLQLARVRVDP
jgi:hypothetical protein